MLDIQNLSQVAGVSLVSGIWQGFLLAAAVGLCLRLVPKTTAALRFAIWSAVFLIIALLPWLESVRHGHQSGPAAASIIHLDAHWSVAIVAVWLALSLYRAGDLVLHALRLRSLRKRSTVVEPPAGCDTLTAGTILRRVQLCTSPDVDRPSVIGFFSPRILIPAWLFDQLSSVELEQVLLHELEHLRRGDDWLNLLQKLSLVLFPLNPVLMWVERRLCYERELACDDGVLRRTKAPKTYATCLTSLAERGLDRRAISLALGALERRSELARRVHRILRRESVLTPIQARAVMGVAALGLLLGATELARCPQLVSFVGSPKSMQAEAQPLSIQAGAQPSIASPALTFPSAREQNVVYTDMHTPHMTLLKASAPAVVQKIQAKPHPARTSPVQRVKTSRISEQGQNNHQHWIVLTSWSETDHPRMILPVVDDSVDGRTVLLPYAAVPVDGGWLIVQL